MDGGGLHRLGKRLIELSSQVTGESGDLSLTPGEAAALEDVIKHPDSSISEIQQRTGFVQSHVSASVSRLRKRGLVQASPDPHDGRRTRIRVADGTLHAISRRAARDIGEAVARAVPDPDRARRATALLEELAELLL
ncbi:helix-turn-helix domain-containing protein [Streptomyces odontomachi]|uniref:helix-turn-helix domain-containing protein n=1 Tax=Streptomyces odontomachi TaxID=2944940 RepID=UPI00210D2F07|nr:MarR family transcriptional regulator [Streptomyces sp. ODS25]